MRLDGYPVRIDLRAAAEGFLDFALDLARLDARRYLDRIGTPLIPLIRRTARSRQPLEIPFDFAFEGDPSVAHQHLELLGDRR